MTEIRTCYSGFFHLFWKKVKFYCFVLYVPMYFEWATLIMFLIAFFSYKLLNNMAKYVNCHYLITCLTKNDYNLHFTLSSGPAELGTSKESSIFIRECVRAGAQTRRSLGHHLLHPLILRPRALQDAPAPADPNS